jgi:hypothetical protein
MFSSYLEFQMMDRVHKSSDSGFIDLSNHPFEALSSSVFSHKAFIVAFSSNTAPSVGNSSDIICWNAAVIRFRVFQLADVSFPRMCPAPTFFCKN